MMPDKVLPKSVRIKPSPTEPHWKGPQSSDAQGGITNTLLQKYLECKERFRIQTVLGLRAKEHFRPPLEFGNLWHVCEEAPQDRWKPAFHEAVRLMRQQYPSDGEAIVHWASKIEALYPVYLAYWQDHVDEEKREVLQPEQRFHVAYTLPSDRAVYLRGKIDSVDLQGVGKDRGLFIRENKSKSQINRTRLAGQLSFDLQTMLYLVALEAERSRLDDSTIKTKCSYQQGENRIHYPLKGVYYNVVRRGAHKTAESMMKKVNEDIGDSRGGEWFDRFKVTLRPGDIQRFRTQCLDPLLENVCDDYEWWAICLQDKADVFDGHRRFKRFPEHCPRHYRHPHGCRNIIDEAGTSDYEDYLATGSTLGLDRGASLFPELV